MISARSILLILMLAVTGPVLAQGGAPDNPPGVDWSGLSAEQRQLLERFEEEWRSLSPGRQQALAIALTAYASASDRSQALDAGFDAHLSKPILPLDLVMAISGLREKQRKDR